MTIDTDVSHVTKPGANLFRELGFSAEEAKLLQAASRRQINDTQRLKEQLRVNQETLPLSAGSSTAASFSNAGSISSSGTHPYPINKPDIPSPGRRK
ncbi:MAG: hypothetical protein QOD67_3752 [Caballeronia sp.]|nr:hypothetical protein [Caballeronia sp.]